MVSAEGDRQTHMPQVIILEDDSVGEVLLRKPGDISSDSLNPHKKSDRIAQAIWNL